MNNYLGLLLLTFNFMACSTMPTISSSQYDLAIKNVKIFDSKTKVVTPNQTILIKGDEISEIIDNSETFNADTIIEGNNRLVMPGFIDTHTTQLHSLFDRMSREQAVWARLIKLRERSTWPLKIIKNLFLSYY